MSVLAFFKYLSLPSSCVCKRACTYLKAKSEVPVRVFLRPLGTSGFCYALCDPSMAVRVPPRPPPAGSVGGKSNDPVWLAVLPRTAAAGTAVHSFAQGWRWAPANRFVVLLTSPQSWWFERHE